MKRFSIAAIAAVAATLALVGVAESRHASARVAAPSKLTICHKTGSESNPWRRITVSSRAISSPTSSAGATLRAHLGHTGDAVVTGTAGCPSPSVTPSPTSTPPAKITICHKTGSATNAFRRIAVSSRAVSNPNSASGKLLRGHMRHTGDMILPGASACPTGTGTTKQSGKFTASLQPVSGASGSGTATVTIRLGKGELCYTLTVTGLTNVTGAHIHRGSTGAVVVPLTAPTTGTSSGCVSVEKTLLQEILNNPGGFYVNVHTTAFPNGQIRGDLTK
jgi:CHRD domain